MHTLEQTLEFDVDNLLDSFEVELVEVIESLMPILCIDQINH